MGKYLRSFFDNKLPNESRRSEDLEGGPLFLRIFVKILHLLVTGSFIFEFVWFHIDKGGTWLDIFCFSRKQSTWYQILIFYASGASASADFFISAGHLFILFGSYRCFGCLKSLQKIFPWSLSRGKHNALAVFTALWIGQISLGCAKPDPNVYFWGFSKWDEILGSTTTILSLICSCGNLVISLSKCFPGGKVWKSTLRGINALVQLVSMVTSVVLWVVKFYHNAKPTMWILLAWWIFRIFQTVFTEYCKLRSPKGKNYGETQPRQNNQRSSGLDSAKTSPQRIPLETLSKGGPKLREPLYKNEP